MGEYAQYNGNRIKIGTCEANYYLRLEDKGRVTIESGSGFGHFWRLPFPDEDLCDPGGYDHYGRGALLGPDFAPDMTDTKPGIIQMRHECGMLVNAPCYHSRRLPSNTDELTFFWNGGYGGCLFELAHIKTHGTRVIPVFRCRACGHMWSTDDWSEVLPHIVDRSLAKRLEKYA